LKPSGIVTLLTDFGLTEPFVGVMKGALLSECPSARLIDLSHALPAQDVAAAAFWSAVSARYFPEGTVALAVVDPGVGSTRAPIVVEASARWFVGPDNGLFDLVRERLEPARVRRIDAEQLNIIAISRTFHGRDLFAPVAGRLCAGTLAFDDVGPPHVPTPATPPLRMATPERGADGRVRFEGRVITVDHFGNLICNVEPGAELGAAFTLEVAGQPVRCGATYSDAGPGEAIGYLGSFGQLEVGVRNGNARERFGATAGTRVVLEGPPA
jgi:S-adenosylmethionine hydrolase